MKLLKKQSIKKKKLKIKEIAIIRIRIKFNKKKLKPND